MHYSVLIIHLQYSNLCSETSVANSPAKKEMSFYGQNKENKFSVKTKNVSGGHGDAGPLKIYPIMSLTPYQNKLVFYLDLYLFISTREINQCI